VNSDTSMNFHQLLALTTMIVGLVSGCSQPDGPLRVTASGKVMLDGVPLNHGLIRFIPDQGPAAATQIQEGTFVFSDDTGPVPGEHRVEIEATDYQGFEIDDEAAFSERAEKSSGLAMPKNPVPAVYNVNSTLKESVSEQGQNRFMFELKSSLK
jgi:hypothetical protein